MKLPKKSILLSKATYTRCQVWQGLGLKRARPEGTLGLLSIFGPFLV